MVWVEQPLRISMYHWCTCFVKLPLSIRWMKATFYDQTSLSLGFSMLEETRQNPQGSLYASYFFGGDDTWCKYIVNLRGVPWVVYCLGDNMMTLGPVPWKYFLTCISRGNAKYIDNPNWSIFDSGLGIRWICWELWVYMWVCSPYTNILIILTGFRIACFCGQMKLCGCVWCDMKL